MRIALNSERTRSGCPILSDELVSSYLSGETGKNAFKCLPAPPGVVLVRKAFWLSPKTRFHSDATLFLISTDLPGMQEEPFPKSRTPLYCYYSPRAETHFIGTLKHSTCGDYLVSLMADLHPDIPLTDLRYVGRVLVAM